MKLMTMTMLALISLFVKCSAPEENNDINKDNTMKKTLVAYFSATGTTEKVARMIAQSADADLFEIEPEERYSAEDLDWTNKQSRSSVEMNDKTFRPAIKNKVADMDQYDTIYVGFPVWWYTAPTIVWNFMESYNFEGKTVIAFATSGGSAIGPCEKDLQKLAPKANWKAGKLLNRATQEQVDEWVESL